MAPSSVIPLFPLPLILLPGEVKPLHIFEERYKKLVHDCLIDAEPGTSRPFGILYAHASGMASIGTSVVIRRVLKKHADGRCDILVQGQHIFCLRSLVCKELYDNCEVEWRQDPSGDWDTDKANEVFQMHRKLLKMTVEDDLPDDFYSGTAALSLRIAPACGLICPQKQKLLELEGEDERLVFLGRHLKGLIQSLERAAEGCQSIQEFWAVRQFLRKNPE
jgi:Lon protease-like protein